MARRKASPVAKALAKVPALPDVDDRTAREPTCSELFDTDRRVQPLEPTGGAPLEENRWTGRVPQIGIHPGHGRDLCRASFEVSHREKAVEAKVLEPFTGKARRRDHGLLAL
jgi:hypothetical protein